MIAFTCALCGQYLHVPDNLAGKFARFVPGWDCHGLPIELGVERALTEKGKKLEPLALRGACRKACSASGAIPRRRPPPTGA